MKAVSYKDDNMITNQRNYPEILLLNATYKLNDLRMPLCMLMCIDGNGESSWLPCHCCHNADLKVKTESTCLLSIHPSKAK